MAFDYVYVRKIMKDKRITQKKLSNLLISMGADASLDTVKSWFRKNPKTRHIPKLYTIEIMSKIFKIPIDNLLSTPLNGEFVATRVKKRVLKDAGAKNGSLVKKGRADFTTGNSLYENSKSYFYATKNLKKIELPQRLQTKTAQKFLKLFEEFGNDALLFSVIEKLKKIEKISTND